MQIRNSSQLHYTGAVPATLKAPLAAKLWRNEEIGLNDVSWASDAAVNYKKVIDDDGGSSGPSAGPKGGD